MEIHSLKHTMLTLVGETGADAFTIMRIAGHSSVTVSQRYVRPTPESLNAGKAEAVAAGCLVPTKSLTIKNGGGNKYSQVIEFQSEGP
jgi:hypothetical protein